MKPLKSQTLALLLTSIICAAAGPAVARFISAPGPGAASAAASSGNLVQNADFLLHDGNAPANFALAGDVEFRSLADSTHGGPWCLALQTGIDLNGDKLFAGSISQNITGINAKIGRWYRFTLHALPQQNFSVENDALDMKVEFFAGDSGFDGKIKHLYPIIQQQRKDLGINGDRRANGAAAWHTYQFDVMLPSPLIDRVRLSVTFARGNAKSAAASELLLTDFSFSHIDGSAPAVAGASAATQRPDNLIPIGGRFFYKADPGETAIPARFDSTNADRLIYHDAAWFAPFANSMSAWLRVGDLDMQGNVVTKDQLIADNVVVTFDATSMIIHTHGLPNHPTGKFPGENPNYIQEKNATYYIALNPRENPGHIVTAIDNSNHALPMGPIGVAANGVVFFNPFDAGSQDATNIMDYCCGHPAPDNTYHYHKYPICINSPWADEGTGHSPLLGWAFDGFPIYGPYVKAGVLAKDAKGDDGLNDFNLHTDPDRGPHYQVTPGKFPYIIGGYWGTPDTRDGLGDRGGRRGPGGGGPGGGGPGGGGGPDAMRGPGGPGGFGGPGGGPPRGPRGGGPGGPGGGPGGGGPGGGGAGGGQSPPPDLGGRTGQPPA